jgi:hypothetical protein
VLFRLSLFISIFAGSGVVEKALPPRLRTTHCA